ncbi:MAG: (d)CMP kinase [Rhizobiales bacterium]|nr:(d)CMP kinase [Hyphomicrobiales bacterium]
MIIAIDGPEASGKGTVAKLIAKKYKLRHLDSGLLYRLTGVNLLDQGITDDTTDTFVTAAISAANQITAEDLDNPPNNIRSMGVGINASKVAVIPDVRDILTAIQQNIATKKPGAVIDGRDIGTVVFPNADFKFWITASLEHRAKRRFLDYQASGRKDTLEEVTQAIKDRDYRDRNRAASPMKKADDAHLIDTSKMSIDAVIEALSTYINAKLANRVGKGQSQ